MGAVRMGGKPDIPSPGSIPTISEHFPEGLQGKAHYPQPTLLP